MPPYGSMILQGPNAGEGDGADGIDGWGDEDHTGGHETCWRGRLGETQAIMATELGHVKRGFAKALEEQRKQLDSVHKQLESVQAQQTQQAQAAQQQVGDVQGQLGELRAQFGAVVGKLDEILRLKL